MIVSVLQSYWRAARGITLLAEGCVIDRNGHLLLIAPDPAATDNWTLPRTIVRNGESTADAVRRALREDLAIVPSTPPELLAIHRMPPAAERGQIATFLIRNWTGEPAAAPPRRATFAAHADLPTSLDAATRDRILTALHRSAPVQM